MASTLLQGIICRKFESNVQDMIVVLILTDGSKHSVLAKGIKNPKSKKAAALELGNLVKVHALEGYNIPIATDVQVLQEFQWWKKDLTFLLGLQLLLEIFQYICYEDNEHKELYALLLATLEAEITNAEKLNLLLSHTIINILAELGTIPDLTYSVDTNLHLADQSIYTIQEGVGYVTENSLLKDQPMETRLVKVQKFMIEHDISPTLKLQIDPDEAFSLLRLHIRWLEHIIERELKGKKIFLTTLSKHK